MKKKLFIAIIFCFSVGIGQNKSDALRLNTHYLEWWNDLSREQELDTVQVLCKDQRSIPEPVEYVWHSHDNFDKILNDAARKTDKELFGFSSIPITREDLFRYAEECSPEWRLNKLIKDSVWLPPIRKDWKEVLYKDLTFPGFIEWLGKQKH